MGVKMRRGQLDVGHYSLTDYVRLLEKISLKKPV